MSISLEKDIAEGISLKKALEQFDVFLQKEVYMKKKTLCFIALTDKYFQEIEEKLAFTKKNC